MSVGTPGALPAVPATAGNLGQGIKYPPEVDDKGRLVLSSGVALVDQSIQSICQTQPKERVMQPDYGAATATFEPVDLAVMKAKVDEQVAAHEPRAINVEFEAVPTTDGALATVNYDLDGDPNTKNLTFPLFTGPASTGPSE